MDINECNRLQDSYLHDFIVNEQKVNIFLVNGTKLRGVITDFDLYSLKLELNDSEQLVMKHAISTILPWTTQQGSWDDNGQAREYPVKKSVGFKR